MGKPLEGMCFCITGSLTVVRRDFEGFLRNNGATVAASKGLRGVTHLIKGHRGNDTAKSDKAAEAGISVVDEQWVRDLVDVGNKSPSASGGLASGADTSSVRPAKRTKTTVSPSVKPVCQYGSKCYRTGNKAHCAEYSHPGDGDDMPVASTSGLGGRNVISRDDMKSLVSGWPSVCVARLSTGSTLSGAEVNFSEHISRKEALCGILDVQRQLSQKVEGLEVGSYVVLAPVGAPSSGLVVGEMCQGDTASHLLQCIDKALRRVVKRNGSVHLVDIGTGEDVEWSSERFVYTMIANNLTSDNPVFQVIRKNIANMFEGTNGFVNMASLITTGSAAGEIGCVSKVVGASGTPVLKDGRPVWKVEWVDQTLNAGLPQNLVPSSNSVKDEEGSESEKVSPEESDDGNDDDDDSWPDMTVKHAQGSGAKPYELKRVGPVYSCTCPAWRNQSLPIMQRTCKHLRQIRGDAEEDKRVGGAGVSRSKPTANAATKGSAPKVMLAHNWDANADPTGWWMSEKLDGVRAVWDGTTFLSRNGNEFTAPDFFIKALPKNATLDGELFGGRGQFQKTVSIVRSGKTHPGWKDIKYSVFDVLKSDGSDLVASRTPFEDRMDAMVDLMADAEDQGFGEVVEQVRCKNAEHMHEIMAKVTDGGGEGLMIRKPKSPYDTNRSHSCLKVKKFLDAEAEVIGHTRGAGRHDGRCGALECKMIPSGKTFKIGTGLSDKERNNPPPVGTTVTYKYFELTRDGVPRFPVYVRVRPSGC